MFTNQVIGWDEHCAWYRRCMADNGRQLLIFEADGVGRGFMNLSGLGRGGVAGWGFFVAPGAPRGTGMRLGEATLGHAFNEYGPQTLFAHALHNKHRSERLKQRRGLLT